MSAVLDPAPPLRATRFERAANDDQPSFARDVIRGLAQPRKRIPGQWRFDRRGCDLQEQVTRLEDHYPGRNEALILGQCARNIANEAGPGATLLQFGTGAVDSMCHLLRALDTPRAYVPIDRREPWLTESVRSAQARWPSLPVDALALDFAQISALPAPAPAGSDDGRRIAFVPALSIGGFEPLQAMGLLGRIGHALGRQALLVVGADANHEATSLMAAYDDNQGLQAAFNLNLLERINRELGADFHPGAFRHEARLDARERCVQSHLVSRYTQRVTVAGRGVQFAMGESIHVGSVHQFSLVLFQAMARRAGWWHRQFWMDGRSRMAVHVLERAR